MKNAPAPCIYSARSLDSHGAAVGIERDFRNVFRSRLVDGRLQTNFAQRLRNCADIRQRSPPATPLQCELAQTVPRVRAVHTKATRGRIHALRGDSSRGAAVPLS